MSNNYFIKFVLIISFMIILIIGGINFIVDPFLQYRTPLLYKVYYNSGRERHLNAGIARNYIYDTVITGSSMTENFHIAQINNILNADSMKFCMQSASAHELNWILNKIFMSKKNHEVKRVIYGVDFYAYSGDVKRFHYGEANFPKHLYDENYFNDAKYLVSLDTLKNSISAFVLDRSKPKDDPLFDKNMAYDWMHNEKHKFGAKNTLKDFKEKKAEAGFKLENYRFYKFKESFDANTLPLLKENPNVEFIFFYPPYSILGYKFIEKQGWFNEAIEFKRYVYNSTKNLKNLKIYDFQHDKNITHNLNLYKDVNHYNDKTNDYMIELIAKDSHRVDDKNINLGLEELENQVKNYSLTP
ncbi:MAG: hypothetical protein IE881_06045 [Epsilonproteobacteria bacterium]|nr:hypothetical protein [Campylobacterota bacterium]